VSRDRAQLAVTVSSAAFAIAAMVAGAANVLAPFERGWWLTAYLLLVGGLSPMLLSRGQNALATRRGEPPAALLWMQWALWNAGTGTVALADMAQTMAGVDAGGVALLVALLLFLTGVRRAGKRPRRQAAALERAYVTLLVVLGSSVVLGTFLAGALPGQ
jgi:hypothetical protein